MSTLHRVDHPRRRLADDGRCASITSPWSTPMLMDKAAKWVRSPAGPRFKATYRIYISPPPLPDRGFPAPSPRRRNAAAILPLPGLERCSAASACPDQRYASSTLLGHRPFADASCSALPQALPPGLRCGSSPRRPLNFACNIGAWSQPGHADLRSIETLNDAATAARFGKIDDPEFASRSDLSKVCSSLLSSCAGRPAPNIADLIKTGRPHQASVLLLRTGCWYDDTGQMTQWRPIRPLKNAPAGLRHSSCRTTNNKHDNDPGLSTEFNTRQRS